MLLDLPSLRFRPRFYSGGEARFHLPLLYDLVTLRQPARIVTLGYGDGQPHFTFCQALDEGKFGGQCLIVRRDRPGENPADDEAWQQAVAVSAETYRDVATLRSGNPVELAAERAEGSVNLLFVDDCDDSAVLSAELRAWLPKLVPEGLVLFHGLDLERDPAPRLAWDELLRTQPTVEFHAGLGLAVAAQTEASLGKSFGSAAERVSLHALRHASAERIAAEQLARAAGRRNASVDLQQVWFDSLLADRWEAQRIMDEQLQQLGERAADRVQAQRVLDAQREQLQERIRAFDELHQDRLTAQLIMDTQGEQLKQWVAKHEALSQENKKLKTQAKADRKLIASAKKSCRKRGRCFGLTTEEAKKEKRSVPERILRELRRLPRKFRRVQPAPPPLVSKAQAKTEAAVDRYAAWIATHEPDAAALEEQRRATWETQPLISLVLPTFDPPAEFLEELIVSLDAQTYRTFEICIADGGSNPATKERLQRWQKDEPRLRLDFLPQNLGIAENTNRALALATGDFFACIDQDDLLAPFALFELARAVACHPEADIFYSDEDRLTTTGQRHAPFFKPEWNPEYLLSSMYLGHLTAYRRALTERIGVFRKEYDLSQDYDFALRATERARAIVHLPHVLYHWREHSASGSAGGKPQARTTNLAALGAAMERRGLRAEIIEYPAANRARLTITEWPRVSIIVPTDSAVRARAALADLPRATKYPDFEVIVVTNSALADSLGQNARVVRFDEPFNFSEKCNRGAAAATGSRLIFFNDDVESGQRDWIQNLIEPLENPEVGAVAPKLLYETGKIQHAGLVTGVRELVGTACHQWPAESTDYTNFAQSMRDVSALSAACLAMRRDDFFRVGEFDAIHTPIAHSDLDLCFKVRAAGMRCVYTPFATMLHRGHASIGALEDEGKKTARETASVYLLQRWPEYTCHDPYFPENMRDWLYADSPTPIRMWAPPEPSPHALTSRRAVLFVSHDLSWSGAPLILLEMARWCSARGFFITVMSPLDGPLRAEFVNAGVPVIADPLVQEGHESFARFAREFDCLVASTIFGAPAIRAAKKAAIPHLWWIHEGRVAGHYLGENPTLRLALREADLVVTPDTVSAQVYQPFTAHPIRILPYGIPDPAPESSLVAERQSETVNFLLLGTIEQRKGQLVLLEALAKLTPEVLARCRFQVVGRAHETSIANEVGAAAVEIPQLTLGESVTHAAALALIRATDVMMSCSWDETGPLILMEALALGKPILSTTVGAVSERLTNEEAALFFPPGDAEALAAAITRLVREPELLARLGAQARGTYERCFAFPRFGEQFTALVEEAITTRG